MQASPGETEPLTAMRDLLRGHPEVALFVALSLGFFLGKRKVGSFSLGAPAGVLLSGVLIGQLHISIPKLLKAVSFAHFSSSWSDIGSVRSSSGRRGGERSASRRSRVILAVAGFLTAYAASLVLGYDKGDSPQACYRLPDSSLRYSAAAATRSPSSVAARSKRSNY